MLRFSPCFDGTSGEASEAAWGWIDWDRIHEMIALQGILEASGDMVASNYILSFRDEMLGEP